jgi:hypothetical protein
VTVSWPGGRQAAVPEVVVTGYNVRA